MSTAHTSLNFRNNKRAEWTRGSHLRHQFEQPQYTLDYLPWDNSGNLPPELHYVHLGNPCEIAHMSNFYVIVLDVQCCKVKTNW